MNCPRCKSDKGKLTIKPFDVTMELTEENYKVESECFVCDGCRHVWMDAIQTEAHLERMMKRCDSVVITNTGIIER